ncbi:MAG: 50S ribosomal protein L9 [Synergistetes bacterium]|nr:MAG: 50S ribosomal protein L9 [bacterium 42_11]MBC7331491.1 50S ribosomal protein L9 [Synergistota bacterium]MDK2871155.1 large subunit ribosomal protein [bacterium]
MKVVLLEDVPKLGKRGDVVNVADGYARNFLIPKRLAVMATEGEISRLKSEVLKKKEKEERRRKVLLEIKENLEGKEVILKAKAGNKGKLFGSITASEIAEAIKKTMGIDIDKKVVELASPIKEVGEHVVKLKLGLGIETEVKVRVEPEA